IKRWAIEDWPNCEELGRMLRNEGQEDVKNILNYMQKGSATDTNAASALLKFAPGVLANDRRAHWIAQLESEVQKNQTEGSLSFLKFFNLDDQMPSSLDTNG